MRSGSEAGSGCVRRSADPVQSSFSGRPLGPVQHNSISNSPPAGPGHTRMRSISREKEEVRKTDDAVCWWGGGDNKPRSGLMLVIPNQVVRCPLNC